MMNRKMFMSINIHITVLENWHGYIQIYTNIGISTNITKIISNSSPTTFISLQTLVLEIFASNKKAFAKVASTHTQ